MPRPSNPAWLKTYGKDGSNWHAQPQEMPAITNRMFAGGDKDFIAACELAGVKPTPRQGVKFRAKKGLAWKAWRENQLKS